MPRTYKIFISSVQNELKAERRAIKEFIEHELVLSMFFKDIFLFEGVPARGQPPSEIFLSEVDERDIYLGIFADKYGRKNADGLAATELEFNRALEKNLECLVFIAEDGSKREPEMAVLVERAGSLVTWKSFSDISSLEQHVYASLISFLRKQGAIRATPFDATDCTGSKITDIDAKLINSFLEVAKQRNRLHLRDSSSPKAVLSHFNLIADGVPTNAGILLFGRNPSRFLPNAQVHFLHFSGTEKRKPIESQQVFEGSVFDVIDRVLTSTMETLAHRVGLAIKGAAAPSDYEIPLQVIREAIVNAVAHRDYDSNGFTQVIVFSNRVEVWNPGELPHGITIDMLRKPHAPIPRNPLIAEPIFRAGYAEKAGSGITDMIADCLDAGLPEPDFGETGSHFVVTIWRDWLTDTRLIELGLTGRQLDAVRHAKKHGKITNQDYQKLSSVSKPTATRDLEDLLQKGVFDKVGTTGRGTYYRVAKKGS